MTKIGADHLARVACVYVRQSTIAQTVENSESTRRQYGLVDRAVELGWPRERVEVIDEDLGRSGASTEGRSGFARLANEVAGGRIGAVLAIEVSRLARSSRDWQEILALCSVARVVVIDDQAIYDPGDANDKLVLDFKGTMSEAELRWLHLRMNGARQSMARRGELRITPPVGFVWSEEGLKMDPDESVRRTVQLILDRFAVEPSAGAVVRWARSNNILFPTRVIPAAEGSDVEWKPLGTSRIHEILHNPAYAGVYVYGRRRERKVIIGKQIRRVRSLGTNIEDWSVRIENAHTGYISWETYLSNQEKLRQNRPQMTGSAIGAPREGPALLCGLLLCGRCDRRMRTSYRRGDSSWHYVCTGDQAKGAPTCWSVKGAVLDRLVEKLFLDTMVPEELELSLAVEREVEGQAVEFQQQWTARIERARYDARRAERRYKAVDPENRVVARTLEREWEERLRELEQVEREYESARSEKVVELTEADRKRIRALARDLPSVWRAPTTTQADRKAMLRIVIEAVCLRPMEVPRRSTLVRVQWESGAVTELHVDRPAPGETQRTSELAIDRIRVLASNGHHDKQIAETLNDEGLATGISKLWDANAVRWVRRQYQIPRSAPDLPRTAPLPRRHPDGRYSITGAAETLGVSTSLTRRWIREGLFSAQREPYGRYKGVWWIEIDEAVRRKIARRPVRRRRSADNT